MFTTSESLQPVSVIYGLEKLNRFASQNKRAIRAYITSNQSFIYNNKDILRLFYRCFFAICIQRNKCHGQMQWKEKTDDVLLVLSEFKNKGNGYIAIIV